MWKCIFCCFLIFPLCGNAVFFVFWFSPRRESLFSLFFDFPYRGKCDFCCFFIFPLEGNEFFIVFHANEQLCEIMIRALISYGADRQPVRPKVAALRVHEPLVEIQEATVARVERNGRPIVAVAVHVVQRTVLVAANTRSREIYGGIRTADFVIEVETKVPSTVYIEL